MNSEATTSTAPAPTRKPLATTAGRLIFGLVAGGAVFVVFAVIAVIIAAGFKVPGMGFGTFAVGCFASFRAFKGAIAYLDRPVEP